MDRSELERRISEVRRRLAAVEQERAALLATWAEHAHQLSALTAWADYERQRDADALGAAAPGECAQRIREPGPGPLNPLSLENRKPLEGPAGAKRTRAAGVAALRVDVTKGLQSSGGANFGPASSPCDTQARKRARAG